MNIQDMHWRSKFINIECKRNAIDHVSIRSKNVVLLKSHKIVIHQILQFPI
jgi:hypothetical protein